MRRRDFIKAVVGSFAASPLAVRAQQRALPTIGLLSSRSPAVDAHLIALIRQGLNETGFVEGQNVAICQSRIRLVWLRSPPWPLGPRYLHLV